MQELLRVDSSCGSVSVRLCDCEGSFKNGKVSEFLWKSFLTLCSAVFSVPQKHENIFWLN